MKSAKGCPNGKCTAYKKKTLFKSSTSHCPECGTALAAVCKSKGCYTFLDDPSKKFCARCEAKRSDRTDKAKKRVGVAAGAIVTAVGLVTTMGDKVLQFASKITKK